MTFLLVFLILLLIAITVVFTIAHKKLADKLSSLDDKHNQTGMAVRQLDNLQTKKIDELKVKIFEIANGRHLNASS